MTIIPINHDFTRLLSTVILLGTIVKKSPESITTFSPTIPRFKVCHYPSYRGLSHLHSTIVAQRFWIVRCQWYYRHSVIFLSFLLLVLSDSRYFTEVILQCFKTGRRYKLISKSGSG